MRSPLIATALIVAAFAISISPAQAGGQVFNPAGPDIATGDPVTNDSTVRDFFIAHRTHTYLRRDPERLGNFVLSEIGSDHFCMLMIKGQNPKQQWCYRYSAVFYYSEIDAKTVIFGFMP